MFIQELYETNYETFTTSLLVKKCNDSRISGLEHKFHNKEFILKITSIMNDKYNYWKCFHQMLNIFKLYSKKKKLR